MSLDGLFSLLEGTFSAKSFLFSLKPSLLGTFTTIVHSILVTVNNRKSGKRLVLFFVHRIGAAQFHPSHRCSLHCFHLASRLALGESALKRAVAGFCFCDSPLSAQSCSLRVWEASISCMMHTFTAVQKKSRNTLSVITTPRPSSGMPSCTNSTV